MLGISGEEGEVTSQNWPSVPSQITWCSLDQSYQISTNINKPAKGQILCFWACTNIISECLWHIFVLQFIFQKYGRDKGSHEEIGVTSIQFMQFGRKFPLQFSWFLILTESLSEFLVTSLLGGFSWLMSFLITKKLIQSHWLCYSEPHSTTQLPSWILDLKILTPNNKTNAKTLKWANVCKEKHTIVFSKEGQQKKRSRRWPKEKTFGWGDKKKDRCGRKCDFERRQRMSHLSANCCSSHCLIVLPTEDPLHTYTHVAAVLSLQRMQNCLIYISEGVLSKL